METHSSVLAWRIPGTEEPGGLPSMGWHRVGHDWCNLAAAAVVWRILGLEWAYWWVRPGPKASVTHWLVNPHPMVSGYRAWESHGWCHLVGRWDSGLMPAYWWEDSVSRVSGYGDLRVLELVCWLTGWWGQGSLGCPGIVTWPLLGEASLKPSASPLDPGLSDCRALASWSWCQCTVVGGWTGPSGELYHIPGWL